ncbi:RNase J family beta-CASP ribonuclease [Bacillus lacus]|uniref:Ribonuclease J n=1 Tax=Metabacillus lacus TaxID=1983721 RepID=A0A7X2IVW3_9BACI|nr:ribonuclease J [Metabacillus lacus]MRX70649.1 RNase J family beta-CASP ribonuclease [Metabacillus lacus]
MNIRQAEKIKLISLGGVGELGKNMYVVEIDQSIFVVDAGLMYPEGEMLGIDVVIPDITYLTENANRVKGVFLTHGHDENIGGIFNIIKYIPAVPVYGTRLTLALVAEKIKEYGIKSTTNLKGIQASTELIIENTKISFFQTNHSIPDSIGVCFHTSMGAIVHTGDFKFDQTKYGSSQSDIGKMARIGEEGVLCLLSDSTNAEIPGFTKSESSVAQAISDAMYNAPGRIILAAYASNFNRIQQIVDGAAENNRRLVIVGKPLMNLISMAIRLGYIQADEDAFLPVQEISKHPDKQIAILTTGHKSEPLAGLTRLAKGTVKHITISKTDTVLIAATPIPGHEISFTKTIDLLARAGANVLGGKHTHVSGHGYQEELKMMLNIMKPQYFIPIQGEFKMQRAHAKLANSTGIPDDRIFLIEKGDVVEFTPDHVRTGSKVSTGNVLIDGLGVGDIGNIVLRDRRLLSQDGILIVVVTLDRKRKNIVAGPEIISRGFVYVRESEALLEKSTVIVSEIVSATMQEQAIEWSSLKLKIRESLNQFLYEKTKRRPMILPIIMEV